MVESHEYKGLWWLPSDENEQLPGTLTIAKGEASLELLGHFGHEILYETETEKVASGTLAEQPRILGLTSDGKPVTLEGHVSAPYTEHFPGIPIATYARSVTLIGRHFAEGEEIGFDEIAIRARDLNTWTQVFALQGTYGRRKGQQTFTKGTVRFEVPDHIEIPLAEARMHRSSSSCTAKVSTFLPIMPLLHRPPRSICASPDSPAFSRSSSASARSATF